MSTKQETAQEKFLYKRNTLFMLVLIAKEWNQLPNS